ncbi:hypothetical protein AAE478_009010 [Parahypoxylon ruwenzoriense]
MPALGYRKSRNGCLRCKQRRIKCDESRPCGACVRHELACSLMVTQSPQQAQPSSSRTGSRNHFPQQNTRRALRQLRRLKPNPEVGCDRSSSLSVSAPTVVSDIYLDSNPSQPSNTDHYPYFEKFITNQITEHPELPIPNNSWNGDLELMHHWSTHTHLTLPRAKGVKKVWQSKVPRMALEYRFLMNQMLAVAAFHLAFLHPGRSQFYLLQASCHQNYAVQGMRAALDEITADNCHALFAASALLVLGGHAAVTVQSEGSGASGASVEDLLDIFMLTRGVHDLLRTSDDALSKGPLRDLFCLPEVSSSPRRAEVQVVIDRLTILSSRLATRHLDSDVAALTEAGIMSLIACIRSATATVELPDIRVVTTWPVYLNADFIALLRRGHPAPMAVLACFCVIIRATEAIFWYLRVVLGYSKWVKHKILQMDKDNMMHTYVEA